MRSLSFALLFFLLIGFVASPATAQDRGLGVGATLGAQNPTGISTKLWLGPRQALTGTTEFAVGETQSQFIQQVNFVVHNFDVVEVEAGTLSLYYGIGIEVDLIEDFDNQLRLRGPLGTSYMLEDAPLDFFLEIGPQLQVTDPARFSLGGNLGIRLFFDT